MFSVNKKIAVCLNCQQVVDYDEGAGWSYVVLAYTHSSSKNLVRSTQGSGHWPFPLSYWSATKTGANTLIVQIEEQAQGRFIFSRQSRHFLTACFGIVSQLCNLMKLTPRLISFLLLYNKFLFPGLPDFYRQHHITQRRWKVSPYRRFRRTRFVSLCVWSPINLYINLYES